MFGILIYLDRHAKITMYICILTDNEDSESQISSSWHVCIYGKTNDSSTSLIHKHFIPKSERAHSTSRAHIVSKKKKQKFRRYNSVICTLISVENYDVTEVGVKTFLLVMQYYEKTVWCSFLNKSNVCTFGRSKWLHITILIPEFDSVLEYKIIRVGNTNFLKMLKISHNKIQEYNSDNYKLRCPGISKHFHWVKINHVNLSMSQSFAPSLWNGFCFCW